MNFFSKLTEDNKLYFIAEIGINHNGSLNIAKKLISAAKLAGCNAVKMQKKTPEICVPKSQWSIKRHTPWGVMTYINYKKKMEFSFKDYKFLSEYSKKLNLDFIASCWDVPSVKFMQKLNTPFYKVASASITDFNLLKEIKKTKKPIIISTGMSTEKQINKCIKFLGQKNLCILHCTSSYPASAEELNLNYILKLRKKFNKSIIGYSGHETNLSSTVAAYVLGARIIERHITLDRSMWGTDQRSSIEPLGIARIIRDIETIRKSMGDGKKKIYENEIPMIEKLRLVK